jgi:adenosylhomocysteine nucleosidase
MVHFICALKCEAKSLIAHYRLKKCAESESFPLFISQNTQTSLTISGIGNINTAAATAFTHAFLQTGKSDIWLNIGIAGHIDLDIGEITLAHKIIDQSNQHTWYPQILFSPPCLSMEILSSDKPVTDYDSSVPLEPVFEMEAAGFYATACRFATSELIHVIKIISDNQQHPVDKISESFVDNLVKNKLSNIGQILESLCLLANDLESSNETPNYYDQIIEQWRFTHAERNMLKTCLDRWHVLCPDENPMEELEGTSRSKDVIHQITDKLDQVTICF